MMCVELKRWVKLRSFLDQVGVKGVCFCMFVYAWVAKTILRMNKNKPNLEETKMPSKMMQFLGQGEGCRLVRWLFMAFRGKCSAPFLPPSSILPLKKIPLCLWMCMVSFLWTRGSWVVLQHTKGGKPMDLGIGSVWSTNLGAMARIQEKNESSRSRLASLLRMCQMFVSPHVFHRYVLTV